MYVAIKMINTLKNLNFQIIEHKLLFCVGGFYLIFKSDLTLSSEA